MSTRGQVFPSKIESYYKEYYSEPQAMSKEWSPLSNSENQPKKPNGPHPEPTLQPDSWNPTINLQNPYSCLLDSAPWEAAWLVKVLDQESEDPHSGPASDTGYLNWLN